MIRAVVAKSINGVIGKDGKLPWYIPEDLLHFRQLTLGHVVLMGRKTYESLPNGALKGRDNIVLTRNTDFTLEDAHVANSIEDVLTWYKNYKGEQDLFIIGGEEIYKAFLPHIEVIHLTSVNQHLSGDALFPELGEEWQVIGDERDHGAYTFFDLGKF